MGRALRSDALSLQGGLVFDRQACVFTSTLRGRQRLRLQRSLQLHSHRCSCLSAAPTAQRPQRSARSARAHQPKNRILLPAGHLPDFVFSDLTLPGPFTSASVMSSYISIRTAHCSFLKLEHFVLRLCLYGVVLCDVTTERSDMPPRKMIGIKKEES